MLRGRLAGSLLASALVVIACAGGGTAPPSASAPASAPAPLPTQAASPGAVAGATSVVGPASTGHAVQPGETLCGLLGPGDFAAVGLSAAGVPTLNGDGSTEAYCVYAGTSSATGGLEFDAFTSANAAGSVDVYTTVLGESDGGVPVAELAGVDDAELSLDAGGTFANIAVRAGRLVFDIGLPRGSGARDQLLALSRLVLERSTALR